jgi:hypothetical protein
VTEHVREIEEKKRRELEKQKQREFAKRKQAAASAAGAAGDQFQGSCSATGTLNLLQDYATITEVARDLRVCERTLRRKVNQADGWPCLRWAGRIYLHTPTIRKILEAATCSNNPRQRVTIKRRTTRRALTARAEA